MIEFSLDRVLGAVVIDTRRKKGKDEKGRALYPIKYRITYLRKQSYYRSGFDLSIEDWINIESTKAHELSRTRNLLKAGLRRFEEEAEDLIPDFSFEALNKRLGRGKVSTLQEAFQAKIDALTAEGRITYATSIRGAFYNLKKFSEATRFIDITPEWLRRFETFLLKEGKSRTSIAIYLRSLKVVLNEFGNLNDNQYPFTRNRYDKKFKIREGSGRKIALTLEQIGILMKAPLIKEKAIMSRDLFFFSYLCNGINFADLLRLKYGNINYQTKEIVWQRRKTIETNRRPKIIHAVFLPEMVRIIEKYGNTAAAYNYIFPFLKEDLTPSEENIIIRRTISTINQKLTSIGKNCGIGPVTTYVARHSYATVLKRSGVSTAFISEQLGHSSLDITENYLDSFESEERQKQASKLTDF
jgi:integrase